MFVAVDRLTAFAAAILQACDMPASAAAAAARLVVEADLTGASGHGVFRIPEYVSAMRKGLIDAKALPIVERRGPSVAVVDGRNGLGHLAAAEAARTAVSLASETGVGWVGVQDSNHAGAGAVYASIPAECRMIGIYATITGSNFMAPFGGTEALLGTNPIAIAVPAANSAPFLIDFATSVGSFGSIKSHAARGLPLPAGWMIDRRTGEALTDSRDISEGLLAPVGGHKGSGLAMAIGLLAGVLNGADVGRDRRSFPATAETPADIGHLVIACDPARFMPSALFEAAVARHLAEIADAAPVPGVDRVRWPGERRRRLRAEQQASGIRLDASLVARLTALAKELGTPPLDGSI